MIKKDDINSPDNQNVYLQTELVVANTRVTMDPAYNNDLSINNSSTTIVRNTMPELNRMEISNFKKEDIEGNNIEDYKKKIEEYKRDISEYEVGIDKLKHKMSNISANNQNMNIRTNGNNKSI